jgi:hypothetical protein
MRLKGAPRECIRNLWDVGVAQVQFSLRCGRASEVQDEWNVRDALPLSSHACRNPLGPSPELVF